MVAIQTASMETLERNLERLRSHWLIPKEESLELRAMPNYIKECFYTSTASKQSKLRNADHKNKNQKEGKEDQMKKLSLQKTFVSDLR